MNRIKKLKLNTTAGIIYQCVAVISGFIIPSLILNTYGSVVNGLLNSITQFLGFISLCELGVTAVVQSALYKPLVSKDQKQINRIMTSARRFFRKIGCLLVVYTIVLIIVYPQIVRNFDFAYTAVLIFAVSINLFSQYFFGINAQILLKSDQRAYVPIGFDVLTSIVNVILCFFLIKGNCSVQVFKLVSSLVFLVKPIVLWFYVKKHYNVNYNEKYDDEPIPQKWNGLTQHLSAVVLGHTDIVILTFFSSLKNVSIYSVYYLVVNGLSSLFTSACSGVESLFGNMIAKDEIYELNSAFDYIEWIFHTLITLAFSLSAILIVPFVSVYTKDLNDANYIRPIFGVLLVLAYSMRCFQLPYKILVLSAGHFKQTQNAALIEPIINIVVSLFLVKKLGLVGVAIGTFVAMAYRALYHVCYLNKHLLHRPYKPFVKQILVDLLVIFLITVTTKWFDKSVGNYFEWFLLAIKAGICGILVSSLVNLLLYKNNFLSFLKIKFHK